ncbi:hypothetical protein FE697_009040 [Mumia zhuanghuii]|uniref:PH domain-containing protein n=2 Tax=Mumia TaxID=1546255 RepID=A0ABW1QL81_9ACTN|nr:MULTISPECIES: hypothetical protein [Mumia]KAA1423709.1 hypothetical protein FE697_009040 [Mumia zhuanghuii]
MREQAPPVVRFRTGLGLKVAAVALPPPLIVVGLAVAATVDQGEVPPDVPLVLGIACALSLLIVGLALGAAPSHRWDLVRGRLTIRRREVALGSVTRVVVFPGFRGWVGMSFWDAGGRIARLGADVAFGNRRSLGRDQWSALRTLLAAPQAPALQAYRSVTQRQMATRAPARSLAGEGAVRLVDAQIAWIDSGRRSTDPGSPILRFVRGS